MYIDDGSVGDSGEPAIGVDGHESFEQDGVGYEQDGLVDTVGDHWYDTATQDDGAITVATAHGQVDIGPGTVDTDDDGRLDTAVVHDAQGDTVLYTDSDGDGRADVATELTPDGGVVIADHTADGWTQTQQGHLDANGRYDVDDSAPHPFTPPVDQEQPAVPESTPDSPDDAHWTSWTGSFSDAGSAAGVVRIDNATGQWISQN